jgi:ferredoxin
VRVHVDEDRCAGHGICAALCPSLFALNDDGYSEVLQPDVPADLEQSALSAVRQCPERAISAE